jgi:hypothetical protein
MAATLADIIKDPNYINANPATKTAIFDKYSASDSNYTGANDATKAAIRTKFGVSAPTETTIKAPEVSVAADAIPQRSMAQKIGYPILETVLPTAGAIVGGVPSTVFGPAGTVAGGAAGAGLGYGAAKEIEKLWEEKTGQRAPTPVAEGLSDAAKNVLTGATFEVGGRVILPPVAKAAGWVWDRATGKLVQIKAGKIVQELAGPNLEAVKAAATAAPKDLTAAQAIAGVEAAPLQTLGTRAVERQPYVYRPLEQAQEAARVADLKGVTPDKAAAVAARTAASEPLYKEAASAIIPIDPEMKAIFARLPEGTINAAKELAKREGRPFIFGETVPGAETATRVGGTPQITGESLHYIKRALSDIANSQATKNVGIDAQRATQGVLNDFLTTVETKLPSYGQARQAFKAGSEPVNQAQVLNQMRAILGTPEGRESAKPFLNALGKGEQALLKKATGYARYEEGDLAKVLTPQQLDTVNNIADQLVRNAKMTEQAKAGATMYENVLKGNTSGFKIPNILDPRVAVTNEALSILENKVNKKVMQTLTEGMRSGQSLAKLLDTLPAKDKSVILQTIQSNPRLQSITGFGVNALANQQ